MKFKSTCLLKVLMLSLILLIGMGAASAVDGMDVHDVDTNIDFNAENDVNLGDDLGGDWDDLDVDLEEELGEDFDGDDDSDFV